MRDYRKIDAWKLADDLAVEVYRVSRAFPKEEIYGLTAQFRRAAYSVPSNLAEGSSRESKRDYLHFLYIARGSLTETQYFAHLAHRLGYLSDDLYVGIDCSISAAFGKLHGLICSVEKEAGTLSRTMARVSGRSALLLGGLWSVVCRL